MTASKIARRTLNLHFDRPSETALENSTCSRTINTSIVERQNGTDRNFNARKARKTYEFSKDLLVHIAVTWWVMFGYKFHHPHRSLRLRKDDGSFEHRTPAMAIGIAERPISVESLLLTQVGIRCMKPGRAARRPCGSLPLLWREHRRSSVYWTGRTEAVRLGAAS